MRVMPLHRGKEEGKMCSFQEDMFFLIQNLFKMFPNVFISDIANYLHC